jgi:ABC-type Fe3+-hydroxamate transport system substrate-binding protein
LTKTVVDFGLKNKIVGITNFCVDPPDLYRTAARIGGTKDPDLSAIAKLKPTHVIVNSEENRSVDIEALQASYQVLSTFPKDPGDVPEMLLEMGRFLGVESVASQEAAQLASDLTRLTHEVSPLAYLGRTCVYLIWRDPWMAVSRDTYISRFLERLGFENLINTDARYPQVNPADIVERAPDVIFMSSEPWPFRMRDADAWREVTGLKDSKINWIDGKAMSWYGTSTREALRQARLNEGLVKKM